MIAQQLRDETPLLQKHRKNEVKVFAIPLNPNVGAH
jgi:hypothetical protein